MSQIILRFQASLSKAYSSCPVVRMDKYFGKDAFYEKESPFISGLSRNKKQTNNNMDFRSKYGTNAYEPIRDPMDVVRKDFTQARAKLTEELLADLKRKYMAVKLRKIMAVELLKNRVAGDLKRVVQRMNLQTMKGANSKEFIILGGGPKSLNYTTRKKTVTDKNTLNIFEIEVDVRGYIPDNVIVDTEDNRMNIRAVRVNGVEKALGIVGPSTLAMEKVIVHPPKAGILLLQYNSSTKIKKNKSRPKSQ